MTTGHKARPGLPTPWLASGLTLAIAVGIALWKARGPSDWVGDNATSLLAAVAGASAFFFVAHASTLQRRQMQSAELLTAFELARPDLESLSRRIASNAHLVVETRKDGRPGKLSARNKDFESGDKTAFARLFGTGVRIKKRLKLPSSHNLRVQTKLYADIFENVLELSPTEELSRFLKTGPLGRAYCAIKVARDEDPSGAFEALLGSLDVSYGDIEDPLADNEAA